MSKVFVVSDWHFNHNVEFVWGARGFKSVDEMNEAIIERHNSIVSPEDDIYVLGDNCLGGGTSEILAANKSLIERLNGKLHFIYGNHDTNTRIEMYKTLSNCKEVIGWATMLKYKKYHFYLSHFPTMVANLETKSLREEVLNLYGHTHQTNKFYKDIPMMYHVGLDSSNCYPTNLDDIIEAMHEKYKECLEEI